MPPGVLSDLRVVCPFSFDALGSVTVTVQVQGQDTGLTCTCGPNTGYRCSSPRGVRAKVADGGLLQVKSISSKTLQDEYAYTYSFVFN